MSEPAILPAASESTGLFQVAIKHIFRASIVPLQMGMHADGTPNIVQQPGPMERLEVGTELTDVTEAELQAFGDRLLPMDEAARQALAKARGQVEAPAAETPAAPPPPAEPPAAEPVPVDAAPVTAEAATPTETHGRRR